jgi:hypothetical protein
MAMTYSGLIGAKSSSASLKNWANYALLPVEELITDAESQIYSLMRVREMRAAASLSIALNDSTEPLPTGFLDPIALLDAEGDDVEQTDELSLMRYRVISGGVLTTGDFQKYAIFNEAMNFDVRARAATTLELLYFKLPTALGALNETNWLTVRYPHILRAMLLAKAFAFRQDDARADRWEAKAVAFIESANSMDDLSRRGANFPVENRDG